MAILQWWVTRFGIPDILQEGTDGFSTIFFIFGPDLWPVFELHVHGANELKVLAGTQLASLY